MYLILIFNYKFQSTYRVFKKQSHLSYLKITTMCSRMLFFHGFGFNFGSCTRLILWFDFGVDFSQKVINLGPSHTNLALNPMI